MTIEPSNVRFPRGLRSVRSLTTDKLTTANYFAATEPQRSHDGAATESHGRRQPENRWSTRPSRVVGDGPGRAIGDPHALQAVRQLRDEADAERHERPLHRQTTGPERHRDAPPERSQDGAEL